MARQTNNRTKSVNLRLTPADYETLGALADSAGLSLSLYAYLVVKQRIDASKSLASPMAEALI